MTKHPVEDILIKPFEAQRDSDRVREIVSEIWGGGSAALMEKDYGVIGGRPWGEWTSDSVLALRNYEKHGFHRLTGNHVMVQKL